MTLSVAIVRQVGVLRKLYEAIFLYFIGYGEHAILPEAAFVKCLEMEH